jgi:hypothetical protein
VRRAITQEEVRGKKEKGKSEEAAQFKLDLGDDLSRIDRAAHDASTQYNLFRYMQTQQDMSPNDFSEQKKTVKRTLKTLADELNTYLAKEHSINPKDALEYEKWLASCQPFHWFIEFYEVLTNGGFDVIIGNPPYVESHKISEYRVKGYKTEGCGNIYAPCVERASSLLSKRGAFSMIVPLSGFSTGRMKPYQNHLVNRYDSLYISYFSGDAHPSVLFSGVKYRLCIIIGRKSTLQQKVYATSYLRWYSDARESIFGLLSYSANEVEEGFLRFGKAGNEIALAVIEKITKQKTKISQYLRDSGAGWINYHRSPVFWIRSMDFEPYFSSPQKSRSTDHLKDLYFEQESLAKAIGGVLNSSLFYFWFSVQGNCRNVAGNDIEDFPIGELKKSEIEDIGKAFSILMENLRVNSRRRVYIYQHSGKVEYDEFYPNLSKAYIDKIDFLLADHFGLDDQELDFILNYDIKFRMKRDALE